MGVDVILDPTVDQASLTQPNETKVIWPQPHDAKIDIATIIKAGLVALELDDVPVNEDGAFVASQLHNELGQQVPVVTVLRVSDKTWRSGLGDVMGRFIGAGNSAVTPPGYLPMINNSQETEKGCEPIVPEGVTGTTFGEWSDVVIDVTVTDLNAYRGNQMYLILKYIMLTGQEELRRIGYLDCIRINGQDSQQVQPDTQGSGIMFFRTLTYQVRHPDFIHSLDTLVHLVKQTLTALRPDETTGSAVSTQV